MAVASKTDFARKPLCRIEACEPGSRRDRFRGSLVGLAVGDALGATVEFKPPGTFPQPTELSGGGPFRLKPGEWTDDTSQALCLTESLVLKRGFDAPDAMDRLHRWATDGHLSVNGKCFDIGPSTAASLNDFAATGEPFQGKRGRDTNGALMRLAPVALAYSGDIDRAIRACEMQAKLTHGGEGALGASRFLGCLIAAAVSGIPRSRLLVPGQSYGTAADDLPPAMRKVAGGSYARGGVKAGYGAVECLEAALWAVHGGQSFEDAVCRAANLGDDADTVGAIAGQLAGALWGHSGIPVRWKKAVAWHDWLVEQADHLYDLSDELAKGGP